MQDLISVTLHSIQYFIKSCASLVFLPSLPSLDQGSNGNLWLSKKNLPTIHQSRTTTTVVIPTFPAGYPDQFYPDPVSFSNLHPTRRMLFEAQIGSLISSAFLQIENTTVLSSLREYISVSKVSKILQVKVLTGDWDQFLRFCRK